MNKIPFIFAISLLSGLANAEYNPFDPNPVTTNPAPIATPSQDLAPAEGTPDKTHGIDDMAVDEELKALLKKLESGEKSKMPDQVEYVATANCVDIFYHTDTKTYEERTSRACLKKEAKQKIQQEINKLEKTTENNRGNNVK